MTGLGLLSWEDVFRDDPLLHGGNVFPVCEYLVLVARTFAALAMFGTRISSSKSSSIKSASFDDLFLSGSLQCKFQRQNNLPVIKTTPLISYYNSKT